MRRKTINSRFIFNSLRSRLILLVLLAIIPPLILSIYGAEKERERAIDAAEGNLQRLTYLAAASEAKSLEAARQFLIALSNLPDLRSDAASCSTVLQALLAKNDDYLNLGLIGLNGEVRCSAIPTSAQVNVGDRAHFRRAIAERKFIAGDYVIGRVIHKHTINLTYPVLNAGNRVEAVAFASLDLSSFDKFASDIDLPRSAVLVTADRNGVIIARRPDPEKWLGKRTTPELAEVMLKVRFGTSEITGTDGIKRLHAFAPVGGPDVSDFTVSIGIPSEDIIAAANHAHAMELATLAVIAGFALLAAWFVGEITILRRVKALVRTTDQIAVGNLGARTGIRYGGEEISLLARAFDGMAASLQDNAIERNETQARLFAEKERAQVTLESIGDAVITTDKFGRIQYMNPVAERLTGWAADQAQDLPLNDVFHVVHADTREPEANLVDRVLEQGQVVVLGKNNVLLSRDGDEYAVEDSAAPIRNRDGEIIGVVLVFHDVSESRSLAIQLSHQATHDPLTGLFNRREFERRLELAIESAANQNKHHALLYMDLDRFKIVNDTCGHNAGDELLRQVTALLHPLLRDSDILARLGGDEFGVLLENCSSDFAELIAEKLRKTICDFHFVWRDNSFPIGVSIGLVNFDSNSLTLPDILSAADAACYLAKDSGRNRLHVYCAEDSELAQRQGEMEWRSRLQSAFEEDRFRLLSQEIHAIQGDDAGHTVHQELLLRLLGEDGTLILPTAFIPAAERYHLMPAIDRWVVRTACMRYADACAGDGQEREYTFAINISGGALNDAYFLEFVRDQLTEFKVPYHAICFDIAETTAIANLVTTMYFMNQLKVLGCRFSLDNFGSGMSSFAYLKHLPVDYLKIDGGFIQEMARDPVERAKVEAIHRIGHVMGFKTIAKHVDDEETLAHLRGIGIDYAQGNAIAKKAVFY